MEVSGFEYQAAKSQGRNFLVETLRDTPDGIFCCAVEPGAAKAAVREE